MRFARIALHCLVAAACLPATAQHAAKKPAAPPAIDAQLKAAIATAPKASDYPDSNAVCLLDLSDVKLQPDGSVVEIVRKAYKLFNERARDLAEVNLSYDSDAQRIEVLSARTVRANGTVAPVRHEDIRVSTPGQDYAMYSAAATTGFSLPAIEDNCVIDYSYRKVLVPNRLPGQFAETWFFAMPTPSKLSRLTIQADAKMPVQYRLYNDTACKPVVSASADGKLKTYLFEERDNRPLAREPMMPPLSETAPMVEITTIADWSTIGDWYYRLQKPQAVATPPISAEVARITAGTTTASQKAAALCGWLQDNVRPIGIPLGISGYRPHAASDIFAKRYGDAKDTTNLLIAMLGAAGIHADPALLSPGSPVDLQTRLPSLQQFSHVIALARIDGRDVWLDPTADACPFGDIPAADRGAFALIAAVGSGAFKRIPPYEPRENGIEDHETLTLNEDGSAEMEDRVVMRGSFAQGIGARFRSMSPQQRDQTAKQIIANLSPGAVLKDYKLPEGKQRADMLEMRFTVHAPQYAQPADDLLLVPVSSVQQVVNPFVQKERRYPFYQPQSTSVTADLTIRLPKGFGISRTPPEISIASPSTTQHITFTPSADRRSITIHSEMITRQGSAPAVDLGKMKAFYDEVIK